MASNPFPVDLSPGVDPLRALDQFMTFWCGPATEDPAEPDGLDDSDDPHDPDAVFDVPQVLIDHLDVLDRWPAREGKAFWWEPWRLRRWPFSPDPSIAVVLSEEQGVQSLGYALGVDDPPTFSRVEEDDEPWVPMNEPLSRLLLHHELVEFALGGPCEQYLLAIAVEPAVLRNFVGRLFELPFPPWPVAHSPHRLYAGEDLLVLAGPNDGTDLDDGDQELFICGRVAGALNGLRDTPGIEWESES